MTDASGGGGFKKRLSKLRHDMRTPVGHMIGYAEMLEEDLEEEAAKMHSGDLQAIQNAGHKLLALIDDHLSASRESAEEINVSDAQLRGLRLHRGRRPQWHRLLPLLKPPPRHLLHHRRMNPKRGRSTNG